MAQSTIEEMLLLADIIWAVVITLLVLSYFTVGLRLWVRFKITKSPGWDDLAMVITLMLFTCYCAFILVIRVRGQQKKLFDIEDIHKTLVYIQLSEVFYILTTTTLKISLGLFFLRVLTKRWQTILFRVILSVSAIYGLFYVFSTIFACGDPAKFADTLLGSKKCLPKSFILGTGYLYGLINIISDWIFVLIPICVLMDSKLDQRSKISVSIIMGLGAIGSVSSIMRMVYLEGLLIGASGLTTESIKATIWATGEPGTGMIAASIAILRPLFRKVSTSVRTHTRKASWKSKPYDPDDDTIALTSNFGTKTTIYSTHAKDNWNPTGAVGNAVSKTKMAIRDKILPDRPPPVPPKEPVVVLRK